MALTHISAPDRARSDAALSADNASLDRFALMKLVRQAAPALGLKPPVLATLEVLLSFLPPKRTHHTVFASNQTLVERRNGICERSLRRHIAALEAVGFLRRNDSPNGKRFSRSNPNTGMAMRFGFDLTLLFQRGAEMVALAEQEAQRVAEQRYLRLRLRSALARLAGVIAPCGVIERAQKLLRRRCNIHELETALTALATLAAPEPEQLAELSQQKMSSTDGQNVRHHQRSNLEIKDKAKAETPEPAEKPDEAIDVSLLLEACPEASEFALQPIRSEHEALQHAQTLAPMLGISASSYEQAKRLIGVRKAALSVWILLSMQSKVRNFAAYFHAVTLGAKQASFDPWAVLKQRQKALTNYCPRTI